jgi:hypothetical protein
MEKSKLFLVGHVHAESDCPSQTEAGMRMMGELVWGREHQSQTGVQVVGDYLVIGKHRLLILVESSNEVNAERYAKPFHAIGRVNVFELGRCEAVLAEAMKEFGAAKTTA